MTKIIIVGGGASGLTAGIMAARKGAKVIVLEKDKTIGKKILVTGNGRCNYYNEDMDTKHYNSSNIELLPQIINQKNNKQVLDFFTSIGVVPRIKDGYYYPYSNQAISILNALLLENKKLGVTIVNHSIVDSIYKEKDKFIIKTQNSSYAADKLILASGTYSYYDFDTVNSYTLAQSLNHSIIKPLPALVQLRIDNPFTKKWTGVRVYSTIKLYQDDIFIKEEQGELMLTNYGISGICAMQLSGIIARGLDEGKKEYLVINFVPKLATNIKDMIAFLDNYDNLCSNRKVIEILDNILNYKLGNIIADDLKNIYYKDLTDKNKHDLATRLVEFKVEISATNSFKDSQVTSGGVPLNEINLQTMESLKTKDLYITGELLDVNGDCGGYNLGFAWTTGIIAGKNSAGDTND